MNNIIEMLGPMAMPLLFCSLLMLSLIIERLFFFISLKGFSKSDQQLILNLARAKQWTKLQLRLESSPSQSSTGANMMLNYRKQPRQIIEDSASLWLVEQRTLLYSHLAWLTLLAVVSPLLGLLGTVLGMIDAFQAMAAHNGAISPAVLADGIQQAMFTTAFGLGIAIPSLIAGHAYKMWANTNLLSLENLLNHMLLSFQEISVTENIASSASDAPLPLLKEKQV